VVTVGRAIGESGLGPGDVRLDPPDVGDRPGVVELDAPAATGAAGLGNAGIADEQEFGVQFQDPQRN
jgi:hypothetical protein